MVLCAQWGSYKLFSWNHIWCLVHRRSYKLFSWNHKWCLVRRRYTYEIFCRTLYGVWCVVRDLYRIMSWAHIWCLVCSMGLYRMMYRAYIWCLVIPSYNSIYSTTRITPYMSPINNFLTVRARESNFDFSQSGASP